MTVTNWVTPWTCLTSAGASTCLVGGGRCCDDMVAAKLRADTAPGHAAQAGACACAAGSSSQTRKRSWQARKQVELLKRENRSLTCWVLLGGQRLVLAPKGAFAGRPSEEFLAVRSCSTCWPKSFRKSGFSCASVVSSFRRMSWQCHAF